ncbi:hypothetical protein RW1_005_01560 [Rhodococcus wratislaviensis NBRC 100605]|uniref:Cupin type-2 domain-containing protein n=1 Tax=Rhodococcus wratislaviensis NBRC 100605 TaxID=1219028 RepID=X0PXJ1_RHOWR|nr:hypothetical protein RW1_005_01560 [Rhodococcus wratislaviensis NBRC 100605]
MAIRRVGTGFDENGESVFVSDEQLDSTPQLNTTLSSVWRTDSVDNLQIPPKTPMEDGLGFPVPGGAWALSWTIPPTSTAGEDQEGITEAGDLPSGGAHATDSIDINVVTEGTVVFTLEDGTENTLDTGDTIVVNGVRHTWRNPGTQTARILSFILGAERISNQ